MQDLRMARPWSFQSAGRTVFGARSTHRIGELLGQLGAGRCLLVTDVNLAAHAEVVRASAAARGIECTVFDGGQAEPPVAVVESLLKAVEDRRFDVVIGLGGGSNIDIAKAAALLLTHGGSISDYAGQGHIPGPVLPIVAVPTTAGSGSEVSGACILSLPQENSKLAVVDNNLRPAIALIDPELHRSCPRGVTRDAGIDAFCHAVEAFTIIDCADFPHDDQDEAWPLYQGKHPFTDTLAERAIELIAENLPTAIRKPDSLSARTQMAMGALLAGMAMSNTGLYTVHALTYPVSALTHASHGACNGVLLPAVLDFVEPVRKPQMQRILGLMNSNQPMAGDDAAGGLRLAGQRARAAQCRAENGRHVRSYNDRSARCAPGDLR